MIAVNVSALADTLAKSDWEEIVKNLPEEDLYDMSGQIRDKWVSDISSLKQIYMKLIMKFTKDSV